MAVKIFLASNVLKFYLVPPEGLWELLGALSEI
jgi:hypothetical protein